MKDMKMKNILSGGIYIKKILDVLGISQMSNFKNVRTITLTAVLVALTVIANRILIIPLGPVLEIRFGFIFLSTIAFLFGPVIGFAAGFLTSLLGFLIFPTSGAAFNPLFDLNIGLSGILYAIFLYKRNPKSEYFIIWIVAAKVFVNLICNIIINTRLLIFFGYISQNSSGIISITRVFKNFTLLPGEIVVMLIVLKFVSATAYKYKFIKSVHTAKKEEFKHKIESE